MGARFREGFESSYLCGDDVKLEFLPVVVGLFESLNLSLRIRSSEEVDEGLRIDDRNEENGVAYISLCPSPHPFPQSLETHLQRWHLIRFAEVGLEAHCDVLPRQILFFFELK